MQCKKCPYFQKTPNKVSKGAVLVGFCKLRQKAISDQTINLEMCKDRAVIDVPE